MSWLEGILVTVITLSGIVGPGIKKGVDEVMLLAAENPDRMVIWKTDMSWQPCTPTQVCSQTLVIYQSGRMEWEGAENGQKRISEEAVRRIREAIETTGLAGKECTGLAPINYSKTYSFRTAGEIKEIQYPGCEKELENLGAAILKEAGIRLVY